MKPSVSNLRVLFCPCVVRKATANVETETLHDIRDGNQTHPKINKREAHMAIYNRI